MINMILRRLGWVQSCALGVNGYAAEPSGATEAAMHNLFF